MPKPHGYTGTRSVFLIIDEPYTRTTSPLQPAAGYRSRFRASVGGMRIGPVPEDPKRQSLSTERTNAR